MSGGYLPMCPTCGCTMFGVDNAGVAFCRRCVSGVTGASELVHSIGENTTSEVRSPPGYHQGRESMKRDILAAAALAVSGSGSLSLAELTILVDGVDKPPCRHEAVYADLDTDGRNSISRCADCHTVLEVKGS